jgi:hypothetical protein
MDSSYLQQILHSQVEICNLQLIVRCKQQFVMHLLYSIRRRLGMNEVGLRAAQLGLQPSSLVNQKTNRNIGIVDCIDCRVLASDKRLLIFKWLISSAGLAYLGMWFEEFALSCAFRRTMRPIAKCPHIAAYLSNERRQHGVP